MGEGLGDRERVGGIGQSIERDSIGPVIVPGVDLFDGVGRAAAPLESFTQARHPLAVLLARPYGYFRPADYRSFIRSHDAPPSCHTPMIMARIPLINRLVSGGFSRSHRLCIVGATLNPIAYRKKTIAIIEKINTPFETRGALSQPLVGGPDSGRTSGGLSPQRRPNRVILPAREDAIRKPDVVYAVSRVRQTAGTRR